MTEVYDEERLTKDIEAKFKVGASTNWHRSVTGEPYVVISSQHPDNGMPTIPGTVDEAKRRERATDAETAYWAAMSSFQSYAEGRTGVLYWRVKPQLEWNEGMPNSCSFYMRLLISDKPSDPKFAVCP